MATVCSHTGNRCRWWAGLPSELTDNSRWGPPTSTKHVSAGQAGKNESHFGVIQNNNLFLQQRSPWPHILPGYKYANYAMTPHRTMDSKQIQGDWIQISNLQCLKLLNSAEERLWAGVGAFCAAGFWVLLSGERLATTSPETETLNLAVAIQHSAPSSQIVT